MKYDPKESVGKWDSGQKEILMKVLELSDSDLDNTRMWSKRLKYFFRDAVFADYDVRKISLEEWLKGAEEEFNENDWKDGDHPFSLDRAFLLKKYYDDVRHNRLMTFLVSQAKEDKVEQILKTTPGVGPDEVKPQSYNERVEQIRSGHEISGKIAKDSIGYLKWLISRSGEDVKERAFKQYQLLQMGLFWLELLNLSVVNIDSENDPPKMFYMGPGTKEDMLSYRKVAFSSSSEDKTEAEKAEDRAKDLELYSKLLHKRLTRQEIETALRFIYDDCQDKEVLRAAYRFLHENASLSVFLSWYRLRRELKILDFAE